MKYNLDQGSKPCGKTFDTIKMAEQWFLDNVLFEAKVSELDGLELVVANSCGDVVLVKTFGIKGNFDMGTLEERYQIYLDNTSDKFPLSFDEWLNR